MNITKAIEEHRKIIRNLKDITRQTIGNEMRFHYRAMRDHGQEKGKIILQRLSNMRKAQRDREFEEYWKGRGGCAGQGRG